MRSAEITIRPQMGCRCYGASGCFKTYNLALVGKRFLKLHPHLEPNAAIPINGDVATGSYLLPTHHIPDEA